MAKAESARTIQAVLQGVPSNAEYSKVTINLTTSPQTFTYQFACS